MDSTISFKTYRFANIMLDHTPAGMAIFDAQELRLLEANSSYFDLINALNETSSAERTLVPGTSLLKCEQDERGQRFLAICRTIIATGVSYQSEDTYQIAGRNTTYWNWTLTPIFGEQGNVTHIVQTLNEVTTLVQARQQAEAAQAQLSQTNDMVEEERQRLEVVEAVARCVRETLDPGQIGQIAMDTISTHFDTISACIHAAHPDQQILKLLCAYRPHNSANVHGLKTLDYMPYERLTLTKRVLTEREPIVIEDLQEVAKAGIVDKKHPLVRSGVRGYICIPLWFGDQLEGTLGAGFRPQVCRNGPEVRALVGMGTHIAAALAHARLHKTIENERTRLRAILDQLPEGILIAETASGAISYANPAAARILGISSEEIIEIPLHRHTWLRTHIETTIEGRPLPPWNFIAIRALCGETLTGKETIVIRPDGSRVVTLASSAPLYTERGLMSGAIIVFQDVTAQKTLEQHKNEFFSIANHELRTPITVIQGFAEILQLKETQEHNFDNLTQYALANITEQSHHLTHLIEEMLDISRIEQTQFTLHYAPCNLLSILKHVIDSQSGAALQHYLQFCPEDLQDRDILPANLDEERMRQVFSNLINNAIKYSPPGSTIEIGLKHTAEKPQEVLIWIKDQGIGIAAEDIPHIFKRFHRARNVDRSHSGFGIGLYLVKEVITRHQGRVWVESCEGKGSTFYVALPLTAAP
jgi:two-component system phosphate regulon sensor histidine kinase PhoR